MVEYLPWSKKTLYECLSLHKKGLIPVLDLELTAKCSAASCIYCDSMPCVSPRPQIKELPLDHTIKMLLQAKKAGLKWIYTCGLGEPLEDKRFFDLLDFNIDNGISMSIFTNGLFIKNSEIAEKLKKSSVCIVLKMDTFNEKNFDKILGGNGRAQKIYHAIELLLEAGYTKTDEVGNTDLAFSIVPTTISSADIPEVVEFCLKNNIFPSVGELEKAGNVVNNNLFSSLGLAEEGLNLIREMTGLNAHNYMRPVCPAIITGLHIDNQGNCIVDDVTGLNCKWFLLADPKTIKLGNVRESSITQLKGRVDTYRLECWINNRAKIDEYEKIDYVFGGCGGNPSQIIKLYKEISDIL